MLKLRVGAWLILTVLLLLSLSTLSAWAVASKGSGGLAQNQSSASSAGNKMELPYSTDKARTPQLNSTLVSQSVTNFNTASSHPGRLNVSSLSSEILSAFSKLSSTAIFQSYSSYYGSQNFYWGLGYNYSSSLGPTAGFTFYGFNSNVTYSTSWTVFLGNSTISSPGNSSWPTYYSGSSYSANWGGVEFNSGLIEYVRSELIVPRIQLPSGASTVVNQTAGVWTGMSNFAGGEGYLVQDGVSRQFTFGKSCSLNQCPYELWWDLFTQSTGGTPQMLFTSSQCGGANPTNVSPGDDLVEYVYGEGIGANFDVDDITTNVQCSTSYFNSNINIQAYYSQAILEAPLGPCRTNHNQLGFIVNQIAQLGSLTDYHARFANGTVQLQSGSQVTWGSLYSGGSYDLKYMNQTSYRNTNVQPSFVKGQGAIATWENSKWDQTCQAL